MCIWLFARFCRDRGKSGYLAASYLAWFVAIATYTIQTGAMGGIFFVALRQRLATASWARAVFGAALDTLPFARTSRFICDDLAHNVPRGGAECFDLQFSFAALAQSMAFGVWNHHYHFFWIWLSSADNRLMFVIFALLVAVLLLLLHRVRLGASDKPTLKSLGFALLVAACIAAPTIVLEATSDFMDTRYALADADAILSPFCSALSFFRLVGIPSHYWLPVWRGVITCAAAFVMLLVLGLNRTK